MKTSSTTGELLISNDALEEKNASGWSLHISMRHHWRDVQTSTMHFQGRMNVLARMCVYVLFFSLDTENKQGPWVEGLLQFICGCYTSMETTQNDQ